MITKYLALSFDDGTPNDERLVPLLNQYGIKATFHLNASMIPLDGRIGPYDRLPLDRLRHLYTGHEIASHSNTHPDLTQLSDEQIQEEIEKDIDGLNMYFTQKTIGFAYPFGTFNPRVIDQLKKTPIFYARTIRESHRFDLPKDLYLLDPTCHFSDDQLMRLTDVFLTDDKESRFFLIWGHSYELKTKEDWIRFETFLKRIAHHESIFYGSILDCIEAMKP